MVALSRTYLRSRRRGGGVQLINNIYVKYVRKQTKNVGMEPIIISTKLNQNRLGQQQEVNETIGRDSACAARLIGAFSK